MDGPNSTSTPKPFDYRHSLRYWDVVTQSICLSVSAVCVGMRMCSKFFITKAPGWEDYTCLMAWLGLIGYAILTFEADKHGNGIHEALVSQSDLEKFGQLANISQIIYGPLIFLTKLSILLLYIRAFRPARKSKTFICIQLLLWSNFSFYLADTLVKIFACTPREKIWKPNVPGHCIDINRPILVAAIINVISDFSILLLPIVSVWRLKMTVTKKVGISMIFATGSFGCVSSVMRMVITIRHGTVEDRTYEWFPQFLWTSAEFTSGIIASCLPATPTFFRHFFNRVLRKFSTSNIQNRKGLWKSTTTYISKSTSQWPSRHLHSWGLPSVTELLERSIWDKYDIENARIWNGTQACPPGSYCLTTEVTAEAVGKGGGGGSGSKTDEFEDLEGILKTVELDIESQYGQDG